jgi:hypothetical protein
VGKTFFCNKKVLNNFAAHKTYIIAVGWVFGVRVLVRLGRLPIKVHVLVLALIVHRVDARNVLEEAVELCGTGEI